MSLSATNMQPLINMYEAKRLDKNEILFSRYNVHNLFLKQNKAMGSILSAKNRTNAENSYGNVSKIPVMNGDGLVSIGSSTSCSYSSVENVSALVTLAWTMYQWNWDMFPYTFATGGQAINYVDMDNDFLWKADKATLAMMSILDIAAKNVIETNKNTYWTPNVANYYATTGNSLQIPGAAKADAFNQLAAVMRELRFYETSDCIGSISLTPLTTRLEAQGEGNATNERFQFLLGNFVFMEDENISPAVGISATGYLIQGGNLALVNRNNPTARAGARQGGGSMPVLEWGTMMYPLMNVPVGTFYKSECATGTTGLVTQGATIKETYSFDTEFCWLTPYNSSPSTKQTPIVKFEISA